MRKSLLGSETLPWHEIMKTGASIQLKSGNHDHERLAGTLCVFEMPTVLMMRG
jgi:hypothetical protein